jgi:hypothetical protein
MINGLIIVLASGLSLQSCSTSTELASGFPAAIVSVTDDGTTTIDADLLKTVYFDGASTTMTDPLGEWLKFMREEEKVARDLYLAFYETYKIPVFKNIPKAEQNHMNAVLNLMNVYGIADPASAETGVFVNPDLQALYNDLLAKGKVSLIEALKVGALVEETDIVDLADVYELSPGDDFKALAEALMLGSRNHLRAFNRVLKINGVVLVPSVLDQSAFDEIVTSDWERGTGLCNGINTNTGTQYCGKGHGFRGGRG